MDRQIKVCTDNRLIKPGDYFVAIKGENFDGHNFIDSALQKGAKGVLEEKELYELAKDKINRVKPVIIGVTGSSGKTTVTNFLVQILSTKYSVCLGSLNTKLGLSVSVVNDMDENCKFFIAEMGMDKAGELTDTTKLFPPDIAVITTINHVHLEKLGSMEAIAQAKAEILYGLKKGGVAVLNNQNAWVKKIGREFIKTGGKVVWYSSHNKKTAINIPQHLLGIHNVRNAVCAGVVCAQLGIETDVINKGLQKLKLPKGRLNIVAGLNGSIIIDDTYNANPESTKYALEVLEDYKGIRKIAILGDMLELGEYSVRDHRSIGKMFDRLKIHMLIAVGKKALDIKNASKQTKSYWMETSNDTAKIIGIIKPTQGDIILVKGSQGARMEKVVKALLQNPEKAIDLLIRQDARWV